MENFAPTIRIDGETVAPKGYEWILGFALSGCEWAIKKASEPEFLEMIRADLEQETVANLRTIIKQHEQAILEAKAGLDRRI